MQPPATTHQVVSEYWSLNLRDWVFNSKFQRDCYQPTTTTCNRLGILILSPSDQWLPGF